MEFHEIVLCSKFPNKWGVAYLLLLKLALSKFFCWGYSVPCVSFKEPSRLCTIVGKICVTKPCLLYIMDYWHSKEARNSIWTVMIHLIALREDQVAGLIFTSDLGFMSPRRASLPRRVFLQTKDSLSSALLARCRILSEAACRPCSIVPPAMRLHNNILLVRDCLSLAHAQTTATRSFYPHRKHKQVWVIAIYLSCACAEGLCNRLCPYKFLREDRWEFYLTSPTFIDHTQCMPADLHVFFSGLKIFTRSLHLKLEWIITNPSREGNLNCPSKLANIMWFQMLCTHMA